MIRIVALTLMTLLLNSCAGSVAWHSKQIAESREEAQVNNAKWSSLKLGMNRGNEPCD
jgi:hypothetical protein